MEKEKRDYVFYSLEINKKLWEDFKKTITKDINLNEAIINLIKKRVEEYNK